MQFSRLLESIGCGHNSRFQIAIGVVALLGSSALRKAKLCSYPSSKEMCGTGGSRKRARCLKPDHCLLQRWDVNARVSINGSMEYAL